MVKKRINGLEALLNAAEADRDTVQNTNFWLMLGGFMSFVALIAIPAWIIDHFGWDMASISDATNFAQFYSGLLTIAAIYFGWGYFLFRFDRRRRRDWCLKRISECRTQLQLIDSHLLSKHFGPHWEHPSNPDGVGESGTDPADRVYRDPRLAIQYLNLAGLEVRCCARIAALYGEWLSEEAEVAESAETLMQLALDVERNALLKADLIRHPYVVRDAVTVPYRTS